MYSKKSHSTLVKDTKASCAIVIQFPHEKQAKALEKNINHGAPDPRLYKKFDIQGKGSGLSIHLHDIDDRKFANGFLLALSVAVKELVAAENEESKVAFHFEGKEEAAAAVCLASMGLWPADFSFSTKSEEIKFKKMRSDIRKQIQVVTARALPIAHQKLIELAGKK